MGYFDSVKDEENLGSFEVGGSLPPLPKGTQVLAAADEAKWDSYQSENFISIRWSVLLPEEHKNRVIFQKIRIEDADEAKRNRALRMLAAVDANAGGKLMAAGVRPTDEALASCLTHKPMVLKLDVWETDDKSKSGNWVAAVSPRKGGAAAPKPEPAPAPVSAVDFDDDIPF